MPRNKRNKRVRPAKPSFFTRMANRGREAASLGRTLVREPRAFPGALSGVIKRSLRTLWDARGGGFYAVGFIVTFIWMEITTLIDEVMSADGIGAFLGEQLLELVLRFTAQSIANTVHAFMWPAHLIGYLGNWGILLLVAGFALFPRFLKAPLTRWMFGDEPPARDAGPAKAP